jgi:hypothetical protein
MKTKERKDAKPQDHYRQVKIIFIAVLMGLNKIVATLKSGQERRMPHRIPGFSICQNRYR